MKYGGELTEQDARGPFAVCWRCQLVYRDFVLLSGDVICPECDQAVDRGIDRQRAESLLDGSAFAPSKKPAFAIQFSIGDEVVAKVDSFEFHKAGQEMIGGMPRPIPCSAEASPLCIDGVPVEDIESWEIITDSKDLAGDGGLESVDPVVFGKIGGM